MNRNQWLLIIGIVLVVCIVGAACVTIFAGSAFLTARRTVEPSVSQPVSPPSEVGPEVVPEKETSGETRATPTTPPAPQRRGGGTLNLIGGDPPTLDPALAQDATSAEYIVELYSGLVTLDSELEVVPDLAESWDISEDGTVYTFHLREDAQFHNGQRVTAQDFKYSIERSLHPATGSVVADTYLGDIVGAKEKLDGRADEVSGVKVVDDHTLEITIDAPKAYFLAKLTYPTAFVVDQGSVEGGGMTWATDPRTAIGTGPFKLAEYEFGQRITLERNDLFYGDPKPALDRVIYLLAGGSPMTMYETGELDVVPVGLTDIDRVLDSSNPLNKELTEVRPTLSTSYIGFNVNMPPFDDVKVRQAFNYALDKDKLIDVVARKMSVKANGILPPGMPGYNPNLKGYTFDPEKARQLIAESSYGDVSNFPEITLNVTGGGGATPRQITAIAEMYKQNLGVEITIEMTDWATYLNDLKAHRYQMFSVGWIADYPDPQDFLDILFHSQSFDNNTEYSNPEVDRLLEQARVEQDQEKRSELYQQAEQIIVDEAPWVPLSHGAEYWLTKPYVKGMIYPPMIIPKLKYVTVEK